MNWSERRRDNKLRIGALAASGVSVDLTPRLVDFLVDYLYPVGHPDYDDLHERWEALVAAILDQLEQAVRTARVSDPTTMNILLKGRWG